MNPNVDKFLEQEKSWREELEKFRNILLESGLEEVFKWGSPCYALKGSNVIGIRGFKKHCALWFFKGALLKDPYKMLVAGGENTQSTRQMRFTSMDEIKKSEKKIREYIYEAIELERSGLKVEFIKEAELPVPAEFRAKLDENPELKTAFSKLTPGRQKDYLRHFTEPKQEKTRISRVEKCIPGILAGKGLNDKYIC